MERVEDDIEYVVLKSESRRTADIVVERDGQVQVRLPKRFTEDTAKQLVQQKRYWIYKSLAEWRDLNATRVLREFRNGEGFLYLGASYRLRLVSGQDASLILKDGRFLLSRDIADQGAAVARRAFQDFYTEKATERLSKRVASFASKVGVVVQSVQVRDLGYRWASCSHRGAIRFHWKVMMAPPKVIDYLAVHELCHLHQRHHTDAFWNEIDKVMPDYIDRKTWLRENGASLDL